MARLAASLVFLLFGLGAALGGDRAELNLVGYSQNFRYFAFEEFGTRDGSGAHYSRLYVIDLSDDSWVAGTPFATEQDGNPDQVAPDLPTVRAKTLSLAASMLGSLGIDVPATTLVLLGDGVPGADGKTMATAYPSCCGPGDIEPSRAVSLALTTFAAKAAVDCPVAEAFGFALGATFADGTTRELHRDGDSLPKSRSCPQDYRLYAIVAPFEQTGPRVALVSSYPFDFEGTSRRFIAVPIDAP